MPVVHAEEEPSSEESHSGGFIIESDRVEGAMDLAEALGGNVEIEEGLITGLKITKILEVGEGEEPLVIIIKDRKSTRLNSSHVAISYAVFCLKKKNKTHE